jgi:hypothetical protein
MGNFSKLIRSIKEKLFGGEQEQSIQEQPIIDAEPTNSQTDTKPSIEPFRPASLSSKRHQPYFIQIGFDFGTSFSKCVCRDVMTDKAWVHIPPKFAAHELPFLIPSALLCMDGKLHHIKEQNIHYPEGGLYHLKSALVKVALGELDDPVLDSFRRASKQSDASRLCELAISCAVYSLAGALGTVREQVRQRMPDFGRHPKDYMAVNLAVPVADAERSDVNKLYAGVLCEAWSLADQLSGHPSIELNELESLRRKNLALKDQSISDACFIYPEVSANVQGFVRSRASSPGMYLFSDTGAATVDQSVFIFFRQADNTDHLTYLHGNVLPCGSSRIEFQAANIEGSMTSKALEMWRERKERGSAEPELTRAKNMIAEQLIRGTTATLACAKRKLYVPDNINEIRLIFGGGGHCEHPYRTSVMQPFSGSLFRLPLRPDVVGLPNPVDLDLDYTQRRWMSRLAVAYGLSFHRSDLAGFTYPRDVEPPEPDQIWPRRRDLPDAPTKDQC